MLSSTALLPPPILDVAGHLPQLQTFSVVVEVVDVVELVLVVDVVAVVVAGVVADVLVTTFVLVVVISAAVVVVFVEVLVVEVVVVVLVVVVWVVEVVVKVVVDGLAFLQNADKSSLHFFRLYFFISESQHKQFSKLFPDFIFAPFRFRT